MSDRIVMSLLGYAASSLAVGFTIVTEILMVMLVRGELTQNTTRGLFGFGLILSAIVAAVAWAPAGGVILYGELKRVRSCAFYVGAGLLCGLLFFCAMYASGLLESSHESDPPPPPTFYELLVLMLVMFAIPGSAAGFAYWAIAGRRAGRSAN